MFFERNGYNYIFCVLIVWKYYVIIFIFVFNLEMRLYKIGFLDMFCESM